MITHGFPDSTLRMVLSGDCLGGPLTVLVPVGEGDLRASFCGCPASENHRRGRAVTFQRKAVGQITHCSFRTPGGEAWALPADPRRLLLEKMLAQIMLLGCCPKAQPQARVVEGIFRTRMWMLLGHELENGWEHWLFRLQGQTPECHMEGQGKTLSCVVHKQHRTTRGAVERQIFG